MMHAGCRSPTIRPLTLSVFMGNRLFDLAAPTRMLPRPAGQTAWSRTRCAASVIASRDRGWGNALISVAYVSIAFSFSSNVFLSWCSARCPSTGYDQVPALAAEERGLFADVVVAEPVGLVFEGRAWRNLAYQVTRLCAVEPGGVPPVGRVGQHVDGLNGLAQNCGLPPTRRSPRKHILGARLSGSSTATGLPLSADVKV